MAQRIKHVGSVPQSSLNCHCGEQDGDCQGLGCVGRGPWDRELGSRGCMGWVTLCCESGVVGGRFFTPSRGHGSAQGIGARGIPFPKTSLLHNRLNPGATCGQEGAGGGGGPCTGALAPPCDFCSTQSLKPSAQSSTSISVQAGLRESLDFMAH